MMGTSDPQPSMFYHINLEQCVTADHPMRKIRPLIDTDRIRPALRAALCGPRSPVESPGAALSGAPGRLSAGRDVGTSLGA
jgi:hypothetical protein